MANKKNNILAQFRPLNLVTYSYTRLTSYSLVPFVVKNNPIVPDLTEYENSLTELIEITVRKLKIS